MTQSLRVLMADTHDPYFNLATEDWIFRDMNCDCQVLYLWRNEPTVVIGRCQNPWSECNLEAMERDNVKLARRQSGGGAVYHDLGNTNFTFLSGKTNYHKDNNNAIIINALKKHNIEAYASGRNDILVEGKKISGSAFREGKDRAFHHGTLLISTDLTKLGNYLNPSRKKLQAKAVESVRMRVSNLTDFQPHIHHENLTQSIIEEFFHHYQSSCKIEKLSHHDLEKIPSLQQYYEKLKDWNWRFGKTPKFTHQLEHKFDWGLVEVKMQIEKGKIEGIYIYSDSLYPDMIELLNQKLTGIDYEKNILKFCMENLSKEENSYSPLIHEFSNWFGQEIA